MRSLIRPALVMIAALTLLCGILYPLAVTGVARALFRDAASGSLIAGAGGDLRGSGLIGQPFSDPRYFWGRPSATAPFPYNAGASSGSNLGPTSQALMDAVKTRIEALRRADPGNVAPVPVDLVTASASGLDPHISPAAARYQVERVARARGVPGSEVARLVEAHEEGKLWGLFGEARVNVLRLNLALDQAVGAR